MQQVSETHDKALLSCSLWKSVKCISSMFRNTTSFGLIPVSVPVIEKADPSSYVRRKRAEPFAKVLILSLSGNSFMLKLKFLVPEQFLLLFVVGRLKPFIPYQVVHSVWVFLEVTVWKVKCEQLPGSYLNSSQMPGPWCKFLHSLFSEAYAPNLEPYTETSSKLSYRSLNSPRANCAMNFNEFIRRFR